MLQKNFQRQMLLLISCAIITIAFSFPTGTEDNITTSLPQNETTILQDVKENKTPLVFIMEQKDPKSNSVVVQFVYSSNGGNSIIESKGSDKDKYTVNHPTHKEKSEVKSNINEKAKGKNAQALKVNKATDSKANVQKPNVTKDVKMMAVSSLTPEEISPLSGKLPKYLYDALNPVHPFPELQFEKPSQISTYKVQRETADSYLPYFSKEKKEPLDVAGPQISPLSMYDREFNVPIFE